jgi:hypothetical protein
MGQRKVLQLVELVELVGHLGGAAHEVIQGCHLPPLPAKLPPEHLLLRRHG